MSRGEFENKGIAAGNAGSVGPQGTGGKMSGGKVKHVNNSQGMEPSHHGSKKTNLSPQGVRQGNVGK